MHSTVEQKESLTKYELQETRPDRIKGGILNQCAQIDVQTWFKYAFNLVIDRIRITELMKIKKNLKICLKAVCTADFLCTYSHYIVIGLFENLQLFSFENQQSPVYVVNCHFSRCPDRC